MLDDLDVQCWEEEHIGYSLYASLPTIVVWIITFPLLCMVYLIKNKKHLSKPSRKLVMGFLYHGYREEFFYWEFAIIYRKVLVILVIVFNY